MANIAQQIINSRYKAVLVFTGGGIGALHQLLTTPGASQFVLDAKIPYSFPALIRWTKSETLTQAVSIETVRLMSENALARARQLDPFEPIIGIACTAALQTNRDRRGSDHACLAISIEKQPTQMLNVSIPLGTRDEQEAYLSEELLLFIQQATI